jgi:hypothetical protein
VYNPKPIQFIELPDIKKKLYELALNQCSQPEGSHQRTATVGSERTISLGVWTWHTGLQDLGI